VSLDAAILLVLLLFAVAGAISGALRQLTTLAAALAGWAAARFGAPLVAPLLFGAAVRPWQRSAAAFGCFALGYLLTSMLGRSVARRLYGPSGEPGTVDRTVGALLGGAKAGLVAWVLLSALALAHGSLGFGSFRFDARRSELGAFAARHNLLTAAAPDGARQLERYLDEGGPGR
jgi:membrane protein required for colicin V production